MALKDFKTDISVAYDSSQKLSNRAELGNILSSRETVVVDGNNVLGLGKGNHYDWISGEFIGLAHFNKKAIRRLVQLKNNQPGNFNQLGLSQLVELLRIQGLTVSGVDVAGDWAELKKGNEIASFVLGTKADSLSRLKRVVQSSSIQDQISFTLGEWTKAREGLLDEVKKHFGSQRIIVRSSALSEDCFDTSNAGGYDSVLNVDPSVKLEQAIEKVAQSYGAAGHDQDQILIQPMIQDVAYSGVAFTQTLEHCAPWYVVNYESNGDTAAITSGVSDDHKTLYVRRNYKRLDNLETPFERLILAIKEIEELIGHDALDIEFAITRNHTIYILQVRPIVIKESIVNHISHNVYETLMDDAKQHLSKFSKSLPQIPGDAAPMYGNMPDWNPAEIIGTSPSLLASSIYRYLIMNTTWATQRAQYGYRDVSPAQLLVSFAGQPYVDVRASFASFIPATVADELAGRCINFYLSWLRDRPELHDKIEFSVVPTCYTANFSKWSERLKTYGAFTDDDVEQIEQGLKAITSSAFNRVDADLNTIKLLQDRYEKLQQHENISDLDRLYFLMSDCCRFGTLPFAHLARSGFVAITLLKDAVDVGVITSESLEHFLASIKTVSHDFNQSAQEVAEGKKDWDEFVAEYGHLRPGTYDITSPQYADDPDYFLRPVVEQKKNFINFEDASNSKWEIEKKAFFKSLGKLGLPSDPIVVERFLRTAIEGREYAKFAFSKSLSEALECVAKIGGSLGFKREDIENLSIQDLLSLRDISYNADDIHKGFSEKIGYQQHLRKVSTGCKLPPLICDVSDFDYFTLGSSMPNFIGSKQIRAECVDLSKDKNKQVDISGKIVLILQADPGYDWIFSKQISGLITMYGGANSHMAIRSAEFGLPAAIGIGQQKYQKYVQAKILELSPAQCSVKIIQ